MSLRAKLTKYIKRKIEKIDEYLSKNDPAVNQTARRYRDQRKAYLDILKRYGEKDESE
jgi:predicted secreted Zn-dependent protease